MLVLDDIADIFSLSCDSTAGQQCTEVDARQLSATFSNAGGHSVDGTFQAWARVAGLSQAVAVPEPTGPSLLLTGLCVVGGVALRRRQR